MKKVLINYLINFILIFLMEILFKVLIINVYNIKSFIAIMLYSLFISSIITILTNMFSKKANNILRYIIYIIIYMLFAIQIVFKNTFKVFFSLSLLGLSDQVLNFKKDVLKAITNNLLYLIIILIPIIIVLVLNKKIDLNIYIKKIKSILILLGLGLISIVSLIIFININNKEYISYYSLYYKIDERDLNIQNFGVLNSYYIDFKRTIFGFNEIVLDYKDKADNDNSLKDKVIKNADIKYEYNTSDLNLESLNSTLSKNVYNYINNNTGTLKNKYTGMFKDKNLIFIVAESFNEIAISEELTPTLYKLTNNGFIFNNYYTPNYLSTIGGEFQALTGLIPDKSILYKWRSGNNYFEYGIANVFKNMGYKTYAYHNNSGYFQDRNKYLKSLGFDNFKACYLGLDNLINCKKWPQSDVEMIDATVSDYINDDKFMTYYMTVSGHFGYSFSGNSMARKNKDKVINLNYSEPVKAYIATQIELDNSLKLLIDKLEVANILDDTVIVLLADHYPYALSISEINEISKYERDSNFEVNHNKLIIWNNKMDKVQIDKVSASPDVLPTVYNLFGVNYDSRLFAGTDILSTCEGLAIFGNRSWITNKGRYNSTTNTYLGLDVNADSDYINKINSIVASKINFSREVIENNSYKIIFNK